ncbi:MAG: N-acetyltransferase family protein [Usitatibacteraceae bacterium]
MQLISCTHATHANEILEILNEAIANSTAIYDYKPRAPESMIGWFKAKEGGRFPVIGVSENGQLLGFASYGTFRAWPAYKYSVEHSVYVHRDHRRKGVGRLLMQALIEKAREQQCHIMVGGIDETNQSSIALHKGLGFAHAGTITQAAFKFGRWLDLAFYQLTLETPAVPFDG